MLYEGTKALCKRLLVDIHKNPDYLHELSYGCLIDISFATFVEHERDYWTLN